MIADKFGPVGYNRFLITIAGFGGLLYGIDIGIISAALLYLSKTISLSVEQTSFIVAAVLGGSMVSSLIAGLLADWLGRRKMMIISGFMFVASVALIVISQSFTMLFLGRLLQGMSGGVIAVVVPLYLAETLGPGTRGKGTGIFQLMLTLGIVIASLAGFFYTQQAETTIAAANGSATLIRAAQDHAWRGMFLSMVYPGIFFFLGTFLLVETPRWLFRQGRKAEALANLRRLSPPDEAEKQLREMESLAAETTVTNSTVGTGSLLQRKYVIPFILACFVLAANQGTGINSVLSFLVVILKQAGMTASHATQGDVFVKVLNCVMTIIGVSLVDKKGRKFLLKLGTGGVVVALLTGAFLFYSTESKRIDVKDKVQQSVADQKVSIPVNETTLGPAFNGRPMALTVLYTYGDGDRVATALSTDTDNILKVTPIDKEAGHPLLIKRASYGPVAEEKTGWFITLCLAVFIASYAIGPGVVVWLALSELMPTRIRSTGMGIALLLNQGVSTAIAAVFLPVVGNFGFYAMFLFWAICTALYFLVAVFFMPETKGRTLEEIEEYFEGGKRKLA